MAITTDDRLGRLENDIRTLLAWSLRIMTDIATVQAAADALKAEADINAAAVTKAVGLMQDMSAAIADLKSQLAGGTHVTTAQLDAVLATLTGATTELQASDKTLADGTSANTPTP